MKRLTTEYAFTIALEHFNLRVQTVSIQKTSVKQLPNSNNNPPSTPSTPQLRHLPTPPNPIQPKLTNTPTPLNPLTLMPPLHRPQNIPKSHPPTLTFKLKPDLRPPSLEATTMPPHHSTLNTLIHNPQLPKPPRTPQNPNRLRISRKPHKQPPTTILRVEESQRLQVSDGIDDIAAGVCFEEVPFVDVVEEEVSACFSSQSGRRENCVVEVAASGF